MWRKGFRFPLQAALPWVLGRDHGAHWGEPCVQATYLSPPRSAGSAQAARGGEDQSQNCGLDWVHCMCRGWGEQPLSVWPWVPDMTGPLPPLGICVRNSRGMGLLQVHACVLLQVAQEIWVCEKQTITKWQGDILSYKEHLKSKLAGEEPQLTKRTHNV